MKCPNLGSLKWKWGSSLNSPGGQVCLVSKVTQKSDPFNSTIMNVLKGEGIDLYLYSFCFCISIVFGRVLPVVQSERPGADVSSRNTPRCLSLPQRHRQQTWQSNWVWRGRGRGVWEGANLGTRQTWTIQGLRRWNLFTPLTRCVQLLMYFSFPGRLIQFIDLGNGVWAKKKKKKKYNILLHLLQWLTGRAAEKKFFSSLPMDLWQRSITLCKMQKLFRM